MTEGIDLYNSFKHAQKKGNEYQWIVENKANGISLLLDNDATYIQIPNLPDTFDGDFHLNNWLGNADGVFSLLRAIEIEAESL